MSTVELVYDKDCPNVEAARRQLQAALATTRLSCSWQEWDRDAEESPAYVRGYGSPTILVNGRDVAGVPPSANANCCRVYQTQNGGMEGVPPVECIVAAIRHGEEAKG